MTFHLPKSKIVILQGKLKKIISDLPSFVNWINWKDSKISQEQILTGPTVQNFIKNLYKTEILNKNLYQTIQTISNFQDITHSYLEHIPSFIETLHLSSSLFDIIELYLEKQKLEEELQWAKIIESKSKADVGMKRLSILNEEIEELETKIRAIHPQYEFLKKNEDSYLQRTQDIKKSIKTTNKTFITKTSQINKLKRKIDTEKPKYDIYSEKIEELEEKFSKDDLSTNSDYGRLTKKLVSVQAIIQSYEDKITSLTQKILEDKDYLKQTKTELAELKRTNKTSSQKFKEISASYDAIQKELHEKCKDREILIKDQVKDLSSDAKKKPPDNIRFSSLIQNDLESNFIRLSKYIDLSVTSPEEYFVDISNKLTKSQFNFKSHNITELNLSKEQVTQLLEIMKSIENSINSLLDAIGLQIILSKIPLVHGHEEITPKFGIHFEVIREDKSIAFEKLTGEEKVIIMWIFECALNIHANITTHVFSDSNYKIKRTKKLLQNVITFLKKEFLSNYPSHQIVILLSKPILEDINQKDMVVTTIEVKK